MSTQISVEEDKVKEIFHICLILRGLPGTGKTTLSEFFLRYGAKIITIDEFWSETNPYSAKKINQAFKWCFQRFRELVRDKEPFIVIDNSNVKKYHYVSYLDYAQRNGYLTSVAVLPHNHLSEREMSERSFRKVGQLTIRKLKAEFEWEI